MSSADSYPTPPPAVGQRRPYADLPDTLRRAVEARFSSPVTEAVTQPGGFSPGVAARLRFLNGRRAFIKGVSAGWNPDTPTLHRNETRIAAALPPSVPSPKLLWTFDDGEWVALVFEDVEGTTPRIPWRRDELARVLDLVTDLASSLTPAPIVAPRVDFGRLFSGWRRFAQEPSTLETAPGVDRWVRRNLDRLIGLEVASTRGTTGETLLHMDLRADNILLTPTRALVVDWPWASLGAPWIDLVLMLPSVAMQGGPDPWEIIDAHPVTVSADPRAVTAVVAGLTGFFLYAATMPPSPGLPTLRRFQLEQGRHALRWLKQRTGWTDP